MGSALLLIVLCFFGKMELECLTTLRSEIGIAESGFGSVRLMVPSQETGCSLDVSNNWNEVYCTVMLFVCLWCGEKRFGDCCRAEKGFGDCCRAWSSANCCFRFLKVLQQLGPRLVWPRIGNGSFR